MKICIYYFIIIIAFIRCNNNNEDVEVITNKNEMRLHDSDSIYKIKGKRIIDSLQPMIDFKLKSGGYLTSKDANSIYNADTTNLENLLNSSIALCKERKFNESYSCLNKLILKDTNYRLEVNLQKGLLWDNVPNNDSTLFYFNKAIKLSPKTAMLYFFRAKIYEVKALYKLAFDDINQAIKYAPKNEDFIVFRGNMEIALEDYKGALKDLKHTPTSMKNDYVFYTNRAILSFKLNSFEDCIEQCDISIKLNPKIGKTYTLRGAANIMLGKNEIGLEDYKKAAELGDAEGVKAYNDCLEYLKKYKKI